MRVTVELFSYFQEGRFKKNWVELATDSTVADLALQLKIKPTDVGMLVINGKIGTAKTQLQSGDRVTLIPIIGGG